MRLALLLEQLARPVSRSFFVKVPIQRRIVQCRYWLENNFMSPYPVRVEWRFIPAESKDERPPYAITWKEGRGFIIRLAPRQLPDKALAIDALLHEWGHVLDWRDQASERLRQDIHSDEFWLAAGRVYRAWHDDEGWRDSLGEATTYRRRKK